MKDFNFYKDNFLNKHKIIDDIDYLDKYIKFLINYKIDINESDIYTEKHHILPRSTFPEYEKESWNIVELSYEDHKLVHLWIFKAINNRTYQRPLNWMMNYYKNNKEISNAAKKGWINLKKDKTKYEKWSKSRSDYMKNLSPDEQRRRANLFWKNITEEEYINFSNKMKNVWTEEKRLEKSKQLNEYYSNPENIEKRRKETQKRWDNLDIEERLKFREKMYSINRDKNKRLDASNKIKNKWKDPEYLNKMNNRRHRKGKSILIIRPNGEEIVVETMTDMERKYKFSKHLIRKYRDKNLKITESDLKENKFLLDCKIKTIENG